MTQDDPRRVRVIVELIEHTSAIAALNDRGVRTARGGRWHVSNVKNLIERAVG